MGDEQQGTADREPGRLPAETVGAAGMSAVCAVMLSWAVWGSPPYAFFGVMKWAVAATCAYWAVLLWLRSRALAPVCLMLLVGGGLHGFGEMRKEEWGPVNLVSGVTLLLIGGFALWPSLSKVGRRWVGALFLLMALIGLLASVSAIWSHVYWVWDPSYWRE